MKIVIIGGVAAGAKAAAKSRRMLADAEINLYTQDTHVSYSSCGLPYFIEGNFDDYKMLLVRSPEEFEDQGVHIHLQNKVIKIIPEYKQILVEDMVNKKLFLVDYDKLIIATGARPFIPNIENINLKNIFTLRTIEDGIAIKEKMKTSKRVAIIGGGYIGIELLEAFVKQGLFVELLEASPYLMPTLDTDMSHVLKNSLESIRNNRFNIYTGELVTRFLGDNSGIKKVVTASGLELDVDMAIIASGVKPNVEIASDAGIKLGKTGAIATDCTMKTNIDDIYACGDCVEENLLITNTPIWMPLGSNANKEGRCAAINACGEYDCFEGILGSAVTRCLDFTISMTGLNERDAAKLGFDPVSTTVTKSDMVGYMPEAGVLTLKLVADKKTKKLIGGQAIGPVGADKRINTLTSAIIAQMTVKDFVGNDLTYAPPYSPTIDPLLNAAESLLKKLN
ncbi:FAD-dependent oxidoreductase [bacterium]|nr:FAD-dependent oxidoreductase [bacterium]